MTNNRNATLNSYRHRWAAAAADLAEARKNAAEAFRGIKSDLRRNGFDKSDIAGVRLAVRRSSETPEQRAARLEAEAIADALAELELGE